MLHFALQLVVALVAWEVAVISWRHVKLWLLAKWPSVHAKLEQLVNPK
jgi:hypothetical protein